MRLFSTRGGSTATPAEAVLCGIAPDGGLYADPEAFRRPFDVNACLRAEPMEMAAMLLDTLLPGFPDMPSLVREGYRGRFAYDGLTPVRQVGDVYALELFHGPTSAFKDIALCMLPRLISAVRPSGRVSILTATSGDTGKAALEGFRDVEGTDITVFYPADGVSDVQKAQMITQRGGNVRVCAVDGNFDDCQRGVKAAFAELTGTAAGQGVMLSSANSINIGRLAPQLYYYFRSYADLCRSGRVREGQRVDYVVPTGNFGDILAGWYAKQLGLPVGRLVCASNINNVLVDFFRTGVYDRRRKFYKTASPSMDILVSSNLERLLFHIFGDGEAVRGLMQDLNSEGVFRVPEAVRRTLEADFAAYCCDEDSCAETIARVYRETGYIADPHTAIGFHAAERYRTESGSDAPTVILSTASPFKFPAAVLRAIAPEDADRWAQTDGFTLMDILADKSGIPVPPALAELRTLPVRHTDRIGRDGITAYVRTLLREG